MGKSSTGILKGDREIDQKKFITHNHHVSDINERYMQNQITAESSPSNFHSQGSAGSLPRNIQMQRVTSEYEREGQGLLRDHKEPE